MPKDLFSSQSKLYARYRPVYPQELFDYILEFVENRENAWDCATGNGQAARVLADHFENVEASDISEEQLKNAIRKMNIRYHHCPAEKTPFEENKFDLITVATAYHWLEADGFHKEATRVGKDKATIAIWAYNLFNSDEPVINSLIERFYYEIIHPYWDAERKHVETAYANVKFDFDLLPSKDFCIRLAWTKEHVTGYLQTWSAVQNFIKKNGQDPVELIQKEMDKAWNDTDVKVLQFPLFVKLGRISK